MQFTFIWLLKKSINDRIMLPFTAALFASFLCFLVFFSIIQNSMYERGYATRNIAIQFTNILTAREARMFIDQMNNPTLTYTYIASRKSTQEHALLAFSGYTTPKNSVYIDQRLVTSRHRFHLNEIQLELNGVPLRIAGWNRRYLHDLFLFTSNASPSPQLTGEGGMPPDFAAAEISPKDPSVFSFTSAFFEENDIPLQGVMLVFPSMTKRDVAMVQDTFSAIAAEIQVLRYPWLQDILTGGVSEVILGCACMFFSWALLFGILDQWLQRQRKDLAVFRIAGASIRSIFCALLLYGIAVCAIVFTASISVFLLIMPFGVAANWMTPIHGEQMILVLGIFSLLYILLLTLRVRRNVTLLRDVRS